MVAGDAVGQQLAKRTIALYRQHGPTGSVIDTDRITRDAPLKFVGVFAQIMQQAGKGS
ncbi:hypothetical protein D9M69_646490 [compost metagenome]